MKTTVNTKTYWKAFNSETKSKIDEVNSKLQQLEPNKTVILRIIDNDSARLLYYFNYTILDIKDNFTLKITPLESSKKFSIVPKGCLSKSQIEFELQKLKQVNKRLEELNNIKSNLKKNLVSYSTYKFVLKTFNLELVDRIIKGYEFNAGYGISTIRIQKKERDLTKDVINWNASLQIKKNILSKGETPYKVLQRDKTGLITKDNGGVPYFVYMNDDYSYWWHWNKKTSNIPNQLVYSFTPIRGENCIIRKLHKQREETPLIMNNYRT